MRYKLQFLEFALYQSISLAFCIFSVIAVFENELL